MDQTSRNQQYDPVNIGLYDHDNNDIRIDIPHNDGDIIYTMSEKEKAFLNRASIFATMIILNMYLPLVIGYTCYACVGIEDLEKMYTSTMLKMSLISSCTICIPMVLYSMSNMYDRNVSRKSYENTDNSIVDPSMGETISSTLIMILLLNVPDLYLLLFGIPLKQDDFIYASIQVRDTFFNLFFIVNAMKLAPSVFTRRVFFTSFMTLAFSNTIYNFSIIGSTEEVATMAIIVSVLGLADIGFNTILWFMHLRKIYGSYVQMFYSMSHHELKCSINTVNFVIYNYAGWLAYWLCPFTLFLVIYTYLVIFVSIMHIFVLQRESADISLKLRTDKAVSESLITRVLPKDSAKEYLLTGNLSPKIHRNVTIFFSDIEDFTAMSSQISPIQIMSLLNRLYLSMDYLAKKFPTLFKVETIGDAYVMVGGLTDLETTNIQTAVDVANFSLLVKEVVKHIFSLVGNQVPIRIRIGLHSGTVVSGVVGDLTPRYCLFGDAMNTASRMESNGDVDKIHISSATATQLMQTGGFVLEERGFIDVKGKGKMKTFWLLGASDENNIVKSTLQAISTGVYGAQQRRYLIANHKVEACDIVKRVLFVYRSKVVFKVIKNKLEHANHKVVSTDNVAFNNILALAREHNVEVVLFQTAANSRIADAGLESFLHDGGFQGIVIFASSTFNEPPPSNWCIVSPFDIEQFNHIVSMISTKHHNIDCKSS